MASLSFSDVKTRLGLRKSAFDGMFIDNLRSYSRQNPSFRGGQRPMTAQSLSRGSSSEGTSEEGDNMETIRGGSQETKISIVESMKEASCITGPGPNGSFHIFCAEPTAVPRATTTGARNLGDEESRRLQELIETRDMESLNQFVRDLFDSTDASSIVNSRLNITYAAYRHCTPLALSIILDNPTLVQALIDLGADVTAKPALSEDDSFNDIATHIHLAARRFSKSEIFTALLSAPGGDEGLCKIPSSGFFPILHYVAKATDPSLCSRVLDVLEARGCIRERLSLKDEYSRTVLHVAAKEGTADVVKLLVEKDIDINEQDKSRKTALIYAARRGRSDAILRLLLSRDADIGAQDTCGRTALHYAVQNEHLTATQILLDSGADPLLHSDRLQTSSVGVAISNCARDSPCPPSSITSKILQALLENCSQPILLNPSDFYQACKHLIISSTYKSTDCSASEKNLQRLCKNNPSLVTAILPGSSETLLHCACRQQNCPPSIVEWLISTYPQDLNVESNDGFSALAFAVKVDAEKTVEVLLKAGADPNQGHSYTDRVRAPLWVGLSRNRWNIVLRLVESGCDVTRELPIKCLRVVEAKSGQPNRTQDNPLMKPGCRITPFEFAVSKSEVAVSHAIARALGATTGFRQGSTEEERSSCAELIEKAKILRRSASIPDIDRKITELLDFIKEGRIIE